VTSQPKYLRGAWHLIVRVAIRFVSRTGRDRIERAGPRLLTALREIVRLGELGFGASEMVTVARNAIAEVESDFP
jgi:hypothetical protein